ncbi:hypothetical protein BB934_45735 (plasmid) [Microvirga ossetica]|uniref:Resolvase/invertase-type recombinase catalytic domain-containing protein n=1 Tax=Microvirga ossetica TaxID=1882682 RepID=A0A1B2F051_9HYPH|nr:recombinase family protein [Microvirga ossetica]ANY85523.1 hypothetical protein BB934_45735 [Microvirga ossetica]
MMGEKGRRIGYGRAATPDQDGEGQLEQLKAAGCVHTFADFNFSVAEARPNLNEAIKECRAGDTFVVTSLDRAARSVPEIIRLIDTLTSRGVRFESLAEGFTANSPAGMALAAAAQVFAQVGRVLNKERRSAARKAADEDGPPMGRPKKLTDEQQRVAMEMLAKGAVPQKIADALGVHRTTIIRNFRKPAEALA